MPDPLALRGEVTAAILAHDYTRGPLLLLAGPGTGKTHCLVETIRAQDKHGLPHGECFEVTLTNASTRDFIGEAKLRISEDFDTASTLHHRAKGILHRYSTSVGLAPSFSVLAPRSTRIVLSDLAEVLPDRDLDDLFSLHERMSASGCEDETDFGSQLGTLQHFYDAVTWHDTVRLAGKLLHEDPEIRSTERGRFSFLLVDEYQDLNAADQKLVQLLKGDATPLLAVGDDDQSIYSGRFADPSGIVDFRARYPDATITPLPVCSRMPSKVIEASHSLVSRNASRYPKTALIPLPTTEARTSGGFVECVNLKSGKVERTFLGDAVATLLGEGIRPSQILVLCNCRSLGRELVQHLATHNASIPVQDEVGSDDDPESTEWLIENLRFAAADPHRNLPLRAVLGHGLGPNSASLGPLVWRSIRQDDSLWDTLQTDAKEHVGEEASRWLTLFVDAMQEAQGKQDTDERLRLLVTRLDAFRPLEASLNPSDDSSDPEPRESGSDTERLRVMTLHSSKGLDADFILIPFMEESVGFAAVNEEEARRLLYVGMTRARVGVMFTWAWSRRTHSRYKCKGGGGGNTNRQPHHLLAECGVQPYLGRTTDSPTPYERGLDTLREHARAVSTYDLL